MHQGYFSDGIPSANHSGDLGEVPQVVLAKFGVSKSILQIALSMSCEGYFQLWHLVSMTPFVRQNPISHVEVDYPLSSSVDLVNWSKF